MDSAVKIRAAIEGNLIAKVKYYPGLLPNMTVAEKPDVDLVNSHLKSSTFNIICNARFEETKARERVREVSADYHAKNLPVCWWVGPSTSPGSLKGILRSEGWIEEATDLGLAADLRKLKIAQPPFDATSHPSGVSQKGKDLEKIEIKQVRDAQSMMDFAEVLASFFGLEEGQAIRAFYSKVAQRGFAGLKQPQDPLQNFVAYHEGKPVATSSYFLSQGVAGFYDCLTIPEMRRRGIGMAMMMKRFQIVLELGVPWVTLSSSHDSRGLYQRLGFQQYCEFTTFVRNAD